MLNIFLLSSKHFGRPYHQYWMKSSNRLNHWFTHIAGNREQVGFGINGNPGYFDRPDYPFPSVRWKEPTPEICCLWEKEKGDWSKLTREEKKELYRASFRQTYAEFKAPLPDWKHIVGVSFCFVSIGIWMWYLTTLVTCELPKSFSEESRAAQCRRMIDLEVNPITGISSHWDYEKDCWKKC
ncbi:hypothetical protein WA026_004898 [Henosepilachna vigintioctopunctata]|uniref:Cytochrome c oxidase subunit 4 n=1 Tax=Henosepilachna vigintioctopunctata TaxID=420089 RepID=A0AAW1UK14_9CUCU